ncbi:MAG: IS1380 family transposase [Bdellovibrionales bacterium]|nr:IS1380 family transposase [Bdellovibrionales bacterium]
MTSSCITSFKPRKLKLVASKKKLTNASGLGTMIEFFDSSKLSLDFEKSLPVRKSNRSQGSYRLGLIQLSSFLYGHDCIDDLIEFKYDPALSAIMRGETVLPRTMGNFLRDFSVQNISSLNRFLSTQAKAYRDRLINQHPSLKEPVHLSIDSTPHEQSGTKMEGLAFNYKDMWCLDSQSVFDQMGLCYGMQLRSGNTKSGVAAEELIRASFKGFSFREEKYLSADAAYCNQGVIKTCLGLGVKFTIAANQATTQWKEHIHKITHWEPWQYSETEIKKARLQGKSLPQVELGMFYWSPSWNEVLKFPIIVKRQVVEQSDLFEGGYKYYGIVTNHNLFHQSLQSVVEHYNKRANVENFIREEKYGYDLKHFPCQKLQANYAFGLLAMVANNILRFMALIDRPAKTYFAKKFRRKFIHIPGQLVSHARSMVLKVSKQQLKEVHRLREAWELKPETMLLTHSSGLSP